MADPAADKLKLELCAPEAQATGAEPESRICITGAHQKQNSSVTCSPTGSRSSLNLRESSEISLHIMRVVFSRLTLIIASVLTLIDNSQQSTR